MPSVSFFFPDRILSVSEEAAGFLVAQLERQSEAPEAVATLAKRIATEAHRGALWRLPSMARTAPIKRRVLAVGHAAWQPRYDGSEQLARRAVAVVEGGGHQWLA